VRNGAVKVTRAPSQVHLPPTVQGILSARIDRLPAEERDLLHTLAVLGREFPLGLAQRVTLRPNDELEPMLSRLRAGEFIYEQPAFPETEYIFKHALTQEVAYNSLLAGRRKLLHERAGQALESMFAGQLDDHLSELAHHYSRSDNTNKAIEYLGRAGQQAMQRCAHADAIGSLTAAIELVRKLPDSPQRIQQEALLQLAVGPALLAVKGWAGQEAERAYTRVRELCERMGDPPELFPGLFGLWNVYFARARLRSAYELAEQLLRRAQSAHDPTTVLYARLALGITSFFMGKFVAARQHLETAISLYDRGRDAGLALRYGGINAGVWCLSYAAFTLLHLGYPEQALKRGNEAVASAQGLSNPSSLAMAEISVCAVHRGRGEVRAAQESAERTIALSAEHGFAFSVLALGARGWAMAEQGHNEEEGIAQIQEALVAIRTIAAVNLPYFLCLLAEAFRNSGRLDEGLNVLTEALAAADENELRDYEAEIHRLKGELLLAQDHSNVANAQSCFERAIEIARNQSAKSLELRATTSLARLLAKQNKRGEARAMLAEIYNWFTEGFDTADLKDARALLEELAVATQ
jgi:predicted ATPase